MGLHAMYDNHKRQSYVAQSTWIVQFIDDLGNKDRYYYSGLNAKQRAEQEAERLKMDGCTIQAIELLPVK